MNNDKQSNFDYPNVITFDDITEIPAFEEAIALQMQPSMNAAHLDAWRGRVAIRDLIRPPKFNGSIRNIEFAAMEDPFTHLLNAKQLGWSMANGTQHIISRTDTDILENTKGFIMTADAKSSGKGVIGEVQAAIWYIDIPRHENPPLRVLDRDQKFFSPGTHGGASIYRRISKPKLEKEKFLRADDDARRVGFSVLRSAMLNPASSGLPRT